HIRDIEDGRASDLLGAVDLLHVLGVEDDSPLRFFENLIAPARDRCLHGTSFHARRKVAFGLTLVAHVALLHEGYELRPFIARDIERAGYEAIPAADALGRGVSH